jgi:hypothetical protein
MYVEKNMKLANLREKALWEKAIFKAYNKLSVSKKVYVIWQKNS